MLAVAFSPDGKTVASGGIHLENEEAAGGEILIWDVDFDSWKSMACEIANRDLNAEEAQRYLHSDSVPETCPTTVE